LVSESKGKRPIERQRRKLENNIKMDLKMLDGAYFWPGIGNRGQFFSAGFEALYSVKGEESFEKLPSSKKKP
jgi:hypothetical protein